MANAGPNTNGSQCKRETVHESVCVNIFLAPHIVTHFNRISKSSYVRPKPAGWTESMLFLERVSESEKTVGPP